MRDFSCLFSPTFVQQNSIKNDTLRFSEHRFLCLIVVKFLLLPAADSASVLSATPLAHASGNRSRLPFLALLGCLHSQSLYSSTRANFRQALLFVSCGKKTTCYHWNSMLEKGLAKFSHAALVIKFTDKSVCLKSLATVNFKRFKT